TEDSITPFVEIGDFGDGTRAVPSHKHCLFSSDDGLLITANDSLILVYQPETGRLLQRIHNARSPIALVADSGQEYLYCGDLDGGVKRLRWKDNQFGVDKVYRYSVPPGYISFSYNPAQRFPYSREEYTSFAFVGRYL